MAKTITVSIKRSGTTVNPGIDVRLDDISPLVIAGAGGSVPHYTHQLYTDGVYDAQGNILILQGDLLTDLATIALATPEQYRAAGNPEVFDEDHIECLMVKNVQVTP